MRICYPTALVPILLDPADIKLTWLPEPALLSRLAGGVNAWAKAEPSAPTTASSGSSASVTTEIAEDQPTEKLRRAPIRAKTAL